MNETIKTIMTRTSCREFQKRNISEEELSLILKAAIHAPSAMNRQVCDCYAVTDREKIEKLAQSILETYQENGKGNIDIKQFAYGAPTFVIVAGPRDSARLHQDGSCMLENIFLAASSLNIGSCWIDQLSDIQDYPKVRDVLSQFGIDENDQVVGCCALGYANSETAVREKNENRIHIIK